MRRSVLAASLAVGGLCAAPVLAGGGGWVSFNNETSTRMPTPLNDPAISTNDPEEKDYAFGDVDQDGWTDLVVVRKQPFTSTGKKVNVLFMNESGVLVDRTDDYITGFNTATNDRDVQLVDVDNDGWLDIVTATTLTDNQSKDLSHPRIYMNQGEIRGVWQGYDYESARIPQMHATAGPRFCSVAFGDLNADGYQDLYFGDYDSGGSQIFDYNNKLLMNQGAANPGFFTDVTSTSLGDLTNYGGTVGFENLALSAFGAASELADMNGDGTIDIVKQTSLNAPQHIAISYNNISNEGVYDGDDYVIYDTNAPYFAEVGDLNGDGMLDFATADDGSDRYYLNTGNNGNGHAQFTVLTFPDSGGFGGNVVIDDLNNDGWNDVIITDVDVDISGCSRTTFIYRNLGNAPNVSMQIQGQVIPNSMLTGVHDAAVFDINNDGWKDIVMGRCSTTQVWINIPPSGLSFAYPQGLPGYVTPDTPEVFQLQVNGIGGANPEPGSGRMFLSIEDGPFNEIALNDLGGNLYEATIPGVPCASNVNFYFEAELDTGATFSDPSAAPAQTYNSVSVASIDLLVRDEMEDGAVGWLTEADASVTSGEWEVADPNGTISGGELAAPDDDATQGAENTMAFVTENGPVGGAAGGSDLDGGPVRLISPAFSAEGSDAIISYARWAFSSGGDLFTVDISNNDGASWTNIPSESTDSTASAWETRTFVVGDFIAPTAEMRVRFSANDNPNNSVTEAGVDNFQVEVLNCGEESCAGDVDGDGFVDTTDILALLGAWGPCDTDCSADFDDDSVVGTNDLLIILGAWGMCP